MSKKIYSSLFFCVFVFFAIVMVGVSVDLKSENVKASTSDAIGIRIVPNPDFLSASEWYKEEGFSGSPQSILVDGYEGIRDGRTVYVNAANVVGTTLYSNIYVISYNQDVQNVTLDIFGQIISKWRFNTNVGAGNCIDEDANVGDACYLDSDCGIEEYCNSQKVKIIRDIKRLSDLGLIERLLEEHKSKHGTYPKMQAGSYLPQVSISTWPSWTRFFAQSLGGSLPIDPINSLGDCGDARFNKITCWDNKAKEFSGTYTKGADVNSVGTLTLPTASNVYLYRVSVDGYEYEMCAGMESGYDNIYGCDEGVGTGSVGNTTGNNAPSIVAFSFPVNYTGKEYKGYIEVFDPDGDDIVWTFIPTDINYNPQTWSGWGEMPVFKKTAIENQIMVYSSTAGLPGTYYFIARIDDGRGGVIEKKMYLKVTTPKPVISTPLTCVESARVNSSYPVCTITASHPLSNVNLFEAIGLPDGMSISQVTTGLTSTASISGSPTLGSEGQYTVEVKASEVTGAVSAGAPYLLTVNTYCGDGVLQKPNTEGAGGVSNNGFEECDINDGLAANPGDSSIDRQYSCSSGCTLGFDCTGACTYTGGYCGDGVVQAGFGEDCDDGRNGKNNDACNDDCSNTFCGDGVIQSMNGEGVGEICDGGMLGGQTCEGLGFDHGNLGCLPNTCQYDTGLCCNEVDGYWSAFVDGVCISNVGYYGPGKRINTRTYTSPICFGADFSNESATETVDCCNPRTCQPGECGVHSSECPGVPDIDCGLCCTPIAWGPPVDTYCKDEVFEQSDDCSTRSAVGTKVCNDLNMCTLDNCSGGGCLHPPDPAMEGVICAPDKICKNGFCVEPVCLAMNAGSLDADMEYTFDGTKLTYGTIGDNYWSGSCQLFTRSMTFEIGDVNKINSFKLKYAEYDDYILIKINGHVVGAGPFGGDRLLINGGLVQYDAIHTDDCELSKSWTSGFDNEAKSYLINGINTLEMTVEVTGGGEGYAEFEIKDYCCDTGEAVNIQICADNEHETFFNNVRIGSAADWADVTPYDVTPTLGGNIIAIRAKDYHSIYGVSVRVNWPGCESASTADVTGWKCTGIDPGVGWTSLVYDDSTWKVPKTTTAAGPTHGNALDVPMIWDVDSGEGSTVWCRYEF